MPTGPIEMHEKWGNDSNAWDTLNDRFIDDRGIIRPKKTTLFINDNEFSAIEYLCAEWDYGYSPESDED